MAGFGQFVGYQPAPEVPGGAGFNFQLANGKSLLITGPEALQLKSRIDASNAVSPQPVAQAAPAAMVNPYRSDAMTPNPAVQAAAPPPPAAIAAVPPASPVVDLDQLDDSEPAPAQGGGGRIISQEVRKGGGIETNYLDESGQLRTRIQTPGSPGVSKEQLKAKAGQAVALPSGGAQSLEGGFDRNADYEESIANANIDQKLAVQSRADQIAAIAEEERQAANAQQAEAAKTVEQDRAKQNEIQSRVDKDLELMNQARDEFKSAKVDPNRVFHEDGGTFRLIGAAIGAAMGAYGASLSHTENASLAIMNRAIDRDVAAQEREIAVKGENANNALQQFRMSTGSLEQAKSALKISQLEVAKAQAAQFEAKYKSADAKAGAQATIAGLDEKIAQELEKYRIESLGKHTAQVTEQYAYPHAGSAGQTIDLVASPEKQAQTIGLSKSRAEVGKVEADTAKAAAEAQAKKGGPANIPRGLQNRYVSNINALDMVDKFGKATGLPKNADGTFDTSSAVENYKAGASNALNLENTAKRKVMLRTMVTEIERATKGGIPDKDSLNAEIEHVEKFSPRELGAWLNAHRSQLTHSQAEMQKMGGGGEDGEDGAHSVEDGGAQEF